MARQRGLDSSGEEKRAVKIGMTSFTFWGSAQSSFPFRNIARAGRLVWPARRPDWARLHGSRPLRVVTGAELLRAQLLLHLLQLLQVLPNVRSGELCQFRLVLGARRCQFALLLKHKR
jgi:hypothetical protein